ncbi:MAG: TetR/AcrR family transcriptional regulator [Thermodesulfobacteriota bacterium]
MQIVKTKVKDPDLIRKKQQQIVKGSIKVFRKKGFHAASIREIARACRMSLGSLYDYIEKKEDILFLVHNEVLNQIYDRMETIAAQYDHPVEQLIHILRGLFDLTCRLKDEMLFIYTETKSLEKPYLKEILRRESEFVSKYRELIERGVNQGMFKCDSPDLAANILIFSGSIIPLRGWNILPRHSEEEVFEALKSLALKILNVNNQAAIAMASNQPLGN